MKITSLKVTYPIRMDLHDVEQFVVGEDNLKSIEIVHFSGRLVFFRIVLKYENNNRVMLLPQQTTVLDYQFELTDEENSEEQSNF